MNTVFDMTLDELQTALDEVLEERRLLIEERDRAKYKFMRSRGIDRLSDEEWSDLNKKIYDCNKMADAYRKRIKSKNLHERERYFNDKNRRNHYGY